MKKLVTFIFCCSVYIALAQNKTINDATKVIVATDAALKIVEKNKPIIDESGKALQGLFKKKEKTNDSKDSLASPDDISGVWEGKLDGRYPYYFYLSRTSDSTWGGSSYLYNFLAVNRGGYLVVQAKLKAQKYPNGYHIWETEFVSEPKFVPGLQEQSFVMQIETSKKGKRTMKSQDMSYFDIVQGRTRYYNHIMKQTQTSLDASQQKAIRDIDVPDIEFSIVNYKSIKGTDSLSYLDNGEFALAIKNKSSIVTPKLKIGITKESNAPVEITNVELIQNGIAAGLTINARVFIDVTGQIQEAEVPFTVDIRDMETGEIYCTGQRIKIPVSRLPHMAASTLHNTASENIKLAKANASKLTQLEKDYLESNKKRKDVVATESGLLYTVGYRGIGRKPVADDLVEITYNTKTMFGRLMESAVGKTVKVSSLSNGLAEIVQLMTEGSVWVVVIPSYLSGLKDKTDTASNQMVTGTVQLILIKDPINKLSEKEFLMENKKREGVIELPSGVQYEILRKGEWAKPRKNSYVSLYYKGSLLDGTTVHRPSYPKNSEEFFINELPLQAWKEVILLLRAGAICKLYIPSQLGYGEKGKDNIPPNAMLIYDIHLLGVR